MGRDARQDRMSYNTFQLRWLGSRLDSASHPIFRIHYAFNVVLSFTTCMLTVCF